MKNTDCVIYITTRRGRTWSYLKEKDGWTQTGPTGMVHRLSAEQLLSHLLPPLAADNPGHLSVRVERRAAPPPAPEEDVLEDPVLPPMPLSGQQVHVTFVKKSPTRERK